MEIKRFSKSLFRNAQICPWRADQIHNKRVKTKMGKPAMDGIEVHALRAEILEGKIALDMALQKASNDDVRRLLQLALTDDPWAGKGKRQIHESTISLDIDGNQIKSKDDEVFRFVLDRIITEVPYE